MSKKVVSINWTFDSKRRFVTFRKPNQMLSADECEKKVWKKFIKDGLSLTNKKKIEVQVSILNTDWLLHDKTNFMEFSQNLNKTKN